jgi:hypothetical protein
MLIYLASPYSHASAAVREQRFVAAVAATAALMQAGAHVVSPIAASHPVAIAHTLPGEYAYWQALDRELIDACGEVWVLCLDGYADSVGVRDECAYALAHGKTVRYVDPTDPCAPLRDAAVIGTVPPVRIEPDAPQPPAGVKHDAGKLRFDLLPVEPLRELARVYTIGAAKYADRNWERGLAWGRVFAAMQRHAWAWWGGEQLDPVDGQHHLASVAWCALALIEYERTHVELDDRAGRAVSP